MLRGNLEAGPAPYGREHSGQSSQAGPYTWFSSLAFIVLLPATLAAQGSGPSPAINAPGVVYGGAVQTPLLFEGERLPTNQASLSFAATGFYDDNVFARNIERAADEGVSLNPRLYVTRQSDRLSASFDYVPMFVIYRQLSQFDRVNHVSDLTVVFKVTSHVVLGVHDNFSYTIGNYPLLDQLPLMSGPPSPTGLDQQILVYSTRVLSNEGGLDLTYAKSQRMSVKLAAGYNLSRYGQQIADQPLYNGSGYSGSLTLEYRETEHTSLGVLLLHRDTSFEGGQAFGSRLRSQIESVFFSVGTRLSPSTSITLFGGPQYIGTVGRLAAGLSVAGHIQGSGGGSLTKEIRHTALDLSFQRSVTGNGGWYTSEISTDAALAVRRRITGQWEVDLHAGAEQQDASLFKLANGKTQSLFGGINIRRPLPHDAAFHISFDSWHQLTKGSLPIYANFDRNQVAIGIEYRLKTLPLGR